MKIAVLASPGHAPQAIASMVRLEAEGHETAGIKFNDAWTREPRSKLEGLLMGVSHLLCIVSPYDLSAPWFAYIVGFARGRQAPISLIATSADTISAAWISDIRRFDDIDEAVSFYKAEGVAWTRNEERRMAKATLLELGISWHAESLAQCVREGDTKAVELFIESGFPPDVRDKSGVPLLCLAARAKHRAIVQLLLARGANIDAQSDDRGYSAVMEAAHQGEQSLLEHLLEAGADTELRSKDGQTALILAVGRSDAAMVVSLLEHGADPNVADKLGLSARAYAKLFHDPLIDAAFASRL